MHNHHGRKHGDRQAVSVLETGLRVLHSDLCVWGGGREARERDACAYVRASSACALFFKAGFLHVGLAVLELTL